MLSPLRSRSAYPHPSGIQFRNPFPSTQRDLPPHHNNRLPAGCSHDSSLPISTLPDWSLPSWSRSEPPFPAGRPPTPPPDMNSVAPSLPPAAYQENGYYQGERSSSSRNYLPAVYSQASQARDAGYRPSGAHLAVRPQSPIFQAQQKQHSYNAIAPSLQIPRTINSSQGSLSELAAQITCLFWFESSAVLDAAEDAESATFLPQPLVTDAMPTTGFRKWVTTILSTTQVAQNVILLALLFIYRLKKRNPSVKGKPGSEYRLLTVALMLGNKFLDDNTYTNKTWAEVSGISVTEVHIMEVEFLSNMKYALFTSSEEWSTWQTLLGRFAAFVERASRPSAATHMPATLPSPPVSTQASPPFANNMTPTPLYFPHPASTASHGPTPRPSPLSYLPELPPQNRRKRSLEDQSSEPAPKRVAAHRTSVSSGSSHGSIDVHGHYLPRVNMGGLPGAHTPLPGQVQHSQQRTLTPQLPPLYCGPGTGLPLPAAFPASLSGSFPASSWAPQGPSIPASMPLFAQTTPYSQMPTAMQSAFQSRQQSPYPGSANASPTGHGMHSASQLHTPTATLSPSYFLAHRNSPYRPVRGVSTLLVPPPARALHQAQNVGNDQMQYQPLGRPVQDRQQGRLPYIAQNQWSEGARSAANTPMHQWPAFMPDHSQPSTGTPHRYG